MPDAGRTILPGFLAEGYPGLERFASHAPRHPHRTAPAVAERVIALRQHEPTWGKQRLADELAKANQWVPLVSPGTVKRILRDAGLWPAPAPPRGMRGRRDTGSSRRETT